MAESDLQKYLNERRQSSTRMSAATNRNELEDTLKRKLQLHKDQHGGSLMFQDQEHLNTEELKEGERKERDKGRKHKF